MSCSYMILVQSNIEFKQGNQYLDSAECSFKGMGIFLPLPLVNKGRRPDLIYTVDLT